MGVGSEMLCVGGQVVLVLVLGIWGNARWDWEGWGVGGENVGGDEGEMR